MRCPYCDKEANPNDIFCQYCGFNLSKAKIERIYNDVEVERHRDISSKLILFIFSLTALALMIPIVLMFIVQPNLDGTTPEMSVIIILMGFFIPIIVAVIMIINFLRG